MKQVIIPFVAAFGLSLGAATGVVVMRTPKAVPIVATAKPPAKADPVAPAKDTATTAATSPADSMSANGRQAGSSSATATQPPAASSGATAAGAAPANATRSGERVEAMSKINAAPSKAVPAAKLVSNPTTAPKPPTPVVKPITDSLIGHRLAQVFSAMQPKDAARVLEQMDDNDVRAILGSLSSKQQAAILGSFPTQRAATILQATLRTASAGGTE
ncbi:MAG: hypothetical protein ABI338_03675 [Gemmatimonadaceae bacterium]